MRARTIALAAVLGTIAATASGQGLFPDSESIGGPPKTYANQPAFDGFIARDGVVYGIVGRNAYRLSESVMLTNNLRIDADGTVTDGNGRVTRLTDDRMVTSDGRLEQTPIGIDVFDARKSFSPPLP